MGDVDPHDGGKYILAATYLSGPCKGQPQYFRAWTAIGPMATPKLEEAERFETEQGAMASPAYLHWSSSYQPVTVTQASVPGCAYCGESGFSPNVECFEDYDLLVCDDCADQAHEDNSQFGMGA